MLAKVVIAAKISNANNAYKKSVVSGAVSGCHQYRRYVGSSSQDVYPPASGSAGSADTGKEQPPLLPGLSPDQIRKIGEMDKSLRERHTVLEATLQGKERDTARRKRIIYRSKQRGWLEADLLLGSWANENVMSLTDAELDEMEIILTVETIDVYNYISGKDALPDHLRNLSTMKKLQAYALRRTMASPEHYKDAKIRNNLT